MKKISHTYRVTISTVSFLTAFLLSTPNLFAEPLYTIWGGGIGGQLFPQPIENEFNAKQQSETGLRTGLLYEGFSIYGGENLANGFLAGVSFSGSKGFADISSTEIILRQHLYTISVIYFTKGTIGSGLFYRLDAGRAKLSLENGDTYASKTGWGGRFSVGYGFTDSKNLHLLLFSNLMLNQLSNGVSNEYFPSWTINASILIAFI